MLVASLALVDMMLLVRVTIIQSALTAGIYFKSCGKEARQGKNSDLRDQSSDGCDRGWTVSYIGCSKNAA